MSGASMMVPSQGSDGWSTSFGVPSSVLPRGLRRCAYMPVKPFPVFQGICGLALSSDFQYSHRLPCASTKVRGSIEPR